MKLGERVGYPYAAVDLYPHLIEAGLSVTLEEVEAIVRDMAEFSARLTKRIQIDDDGSENVLLDEENDPEFVLEFIDHVYEPDEEDESMRDYKARLTRNVLARRSKLAE